MKAKITEKMICIPPHVSTSWDHVTFMQAQDNPLGGLDLIMHLDHQATITIRNLDKALVDLAFAAHLKYMEASSDKQETTHKGPFEALNQLFGISPEQLEQMSIRFGVGGIPGLENLEMAMHHDLANAKAPDLPHELLERVTQLTKMVTGGNLSGFPKPEPHCNCPHCQIARAVHGQNKELSLPEEPVLENELTFRDWEVSHISEQLYSVTNPLDQDEQYQVFLGNPVGCTCGHPHCEHLKAVLRS